MCVCARTRARVCVHAPSNAQKKEKKERSFSLHACEHACVCASVRRAQKKIITPSKPAYPKNTLPLIETLVPRCYCTLYFFTTALLYYCTSLLLCFFTTVLQPYSSILFSAERFPHKQQRHTKKKTLYHAFCSTRESYLCTNSVLTLYYCPVCSTWTAWYSLACGGSAH